MGAKIDETHNTYYYDQAMLATAIMSSYDPKELKPWS